MWGGGVSTFGGCFVVSGTLVLMAKRIRKRLTSPRGSREPKAVQIDPRQLEMLVAQIRGEVAVNGPTFKEMADAWLQANSARLVCPANEWRHIRHLKGLWAFREQDLTVALVQKTLFALAKPIGKLGPATFNKVRATAKRVIDLAKSDKKWLGANPFREVPRAKEKGATARRRIISISELNRLCPFLRPDRRREVRVSYLQGVRPGELLGLLKEDVDFERKAIRIHRSHHRDATKTGAPREIPIHPEAEQDLRDAIAAEPLQVCLSKVERRPSASGYQVVQDAPGRDGPGRACQRVPLHLPAQGMWFLGRAGDSRGCLVSQVRLQALDAGHPAKGRVLRASPFHCHATSQGGRGPLGNQVNPGPHCSGPLRECVYPH